MFKSCDRLPPRERKATPPLVAEMLLRELRTDFRCQTVACLWVAKDSIYKTLADTDCWDSERDAFLYPGPHPVICHPPCSCWGKYRGLSRESISHGVYAMKLVHKYGGVVEQPLGSALFTLYGQGGIVTRLCQGHYGHPALKPTLLYWVLPSMLGSTT